MGANTLMHDSVIINCHATQNKCEDHPKLAIYTCTVSLRNIKGLKMTNQINTLFAVLMMLLLMIVTRGHDNWLSSMLHLPTHFSPTWRFFKPSLSPARTRFKEITH
jgi:hypothetical protein